MEEGNQNETLGGKKKVYITTENKHEMCKACESLLNRNQVWGKLRILMAI
jgi:RNase P subunit RPR2